MAGKNNNYVISILWVRYFGSGAAIGFDLVSAETVLKVAGKYPEIKLILVIPYPGHDELWSDDWKYRLKLIKEKASKIVYTSEQYDERCMFIRNQHLVEHSSWCIAYKNKKYGGTAFTIAYAEEKGLKVVMYPETI